LSRFNLDLRTPTGVGAMRAFIEGDFAGTNRAFRLRHAYGQWKGLPPPPGPGGGIPTLVDLQRLVKEGAIRKHLVIERGGIRFGLFGVFGKEAQIYTNGGAATFSDPVEAAREMVKLLRETEKVDVVIALSHEQRRHRRRSRRGPRDQGVAGHHGPPQEPARQDQRRIASDPGR
jgi:hypothetical protein